MLGSTRNTKPCSCQKLLHPLADYDELPDHVCLETKKQSCIDWIDSNGRGAWLYHKAQIENFTEYSHAAYVAIGGGYYLEYMSYSGGPRPEWPPLLADTQRSVHLIISQWAEVGLTEKQLENLTQRSEWRQIIEEVKRFFEEDNAVLRGATCRIAQDSLKNAGLPITPGMVRYTIRRALPDLGWTKAADPTIGALVTTFLTDSAIFGRENGEWFGFEDFIYSITGGGPIFSDEVGERALRTVRKHQEWWRNLPLSTMSPKVKVGPPRKDNPKLLSDYEQYQRGEIDEDTFWKRYFLRALGTETPDDQSIKEHKKRVRSWLGRRGLKL